MVTNGLDALQRFEFLVEVGRVAVAGAAQATVDDLDRLEESARHSAFQTSPKPP